METLIELKYLNLSFSSSTNVIRAFRAYPLVEIRQTVPCRAIRGNSISVNSTLTPSQKWPPLRQSHVTVYAMHPDNREKQPYTIRLARRSGTGNILRDFKDKDYPFFESDALFLECCVCVVFSCVAVLRIEGCLNSTL